MSDSRKFQGCFKSGLRLFQGNYRGVSRKFQGVSAGFQGTFKEVLNVFHGSFKDVSRGSRACYKKSLEGISRVCKKWFKDVLCCTALITATRAERGFVFFLNILIIALQYRIKREHTF